jgi:hypothetical protein
VHPLRATIASRRRSKDCRAERRRHGRPTGSPPGTPCSGSSETLLSGLWPLPPRPPRRAAQQAGIEHRRTQDALAKQNDQRAYLGRKPSFAREQFVKVKVHSMLGQQTAGITQTADRLPSRRVPPLAANPQPLPARRFQHRGSAKRVHAAFAGARRSAFGLRCPRFLGPYFGLETGRGSGDRGRAFGESCGFMGEAERWPNLCSVPNVQASQAD